MGRYSSLINIIPSDCKKLGDGFYFMEYRFEYL